MHIEERIKTILSDKDEYIFGFADLRNLLNDKFKGHDFCIVIGKRLKDKIMDSIVDGPNMDYFDHYHETNRKLAEISEKIQSELKAMNISCIPILPTLKDEELNEHHLKTLTYDFSHKMAATRAGLGWIGKTDLFISERFGPRLRLVSILVNHPLDCSKAPVTESRCGSCNICVEECPASAGNGKLWNVNVKREEFFDAFACRKKCRELSRKLLNKEITLCGICMAVCPIGKS